MKELEIHEIPERPETDEMRRQNLTLAHLRRGHNAKALATNSRRYSVDLDFYLKKTQ